jgi:hypothetical protein
MQIPSISGGGLLHPQPPCCTDKEQTSSNDRIENTVAGVFLDITEVRVTIIQYKGRLFQTIIHDMRGTMNLLDLFGY